MSDQTVRIAFESVGREKKSWECDVLEDEDMPGTPDITALEHELDAGRALMSRDTSCSFDPEENYMRGTCHAGMHTVGAWRVVQPQLSAHESGKDGA